TRSPSATRSRPTAPAATSSCTATAAATTRRPPRIASSIAGMSFAVRPATLADAPLILEMMHDFNRHEAIAFDRESFAPRLATLVADPTLGGALVFTVDDAAVGYAIVTFGYDLEYGGRDAFLTELFIVDAARGQGAGKRALAAAEAYA